jgi:hypothetical protein
LIFNNIFSRILELTAKENGLEDCLVVLKKGYEKDVLTLKEFLAVKLLFIFDYFILAY